MNLLAAFDVTTNIRTWNEAIQQSFYKAFDKVAAFGPNVLGMIVVIRIVLSFSLEVEIDGAWPWSRWRLKGQGAPAPPPSD